MLGPSLLTALVLSQAGPAGIPDAAPAMGEMATILHDTLKKLARKNNEDAQRFFRTGNHPAALELFKQAHDLDPEDADITYNLGATYLLLGNHAAAEEQLRLTLRLNPAHVPAHVSLAELLASSPDSTRMEESALLLMRARELKGNDPDLVLRQARVAVRLGRQDEAERFFRDAAALGRPSSELRLELGDFFRNMGNEAEALHWYESIKGDAESQRRGQERIRQMEVERQARRFGWSRPGGEIPAQAHTLLSRARTLTRSNRKAEAEDVLRQATRVAPQFTDAHVELAELLAGLDRTAEAETQLLRALAFDQANADVHARLGVLILDGPDASRAAEASILLSRALQLRPDRAVWRLPLARALRLSGDLPGALREVHLVLEGTLSNEQRAEAEGLRAALGQLLKTPPDVPTPPDASPAERNVAERMARARAYLSRGETDAALAELASVPNTDRDVEVLNLEGRILAASGRWPDANAAFRASLSLREDQADVHEQLGVALFRLNRLGEARKHLGRAEQLGNLDAMVHLARVEVQAARGLLHRDVGRYRSQWEARQRLTRFLARAPDSPLVDEAHRLRDAIDGELAVVALPPLLLCVLLVLLLTARVMRRLGGADLRRLITTHPETAPEVQRILAAVRHEVLKHNTMVLSGLVDALERGEDVSVPAAHVRDTLLGNDEAPGVASRLHGYTDELNQLARAHGVTLNLHHKDRALSALFDGFALLRRCRGDLANVRTLSPRRRRGLIRTIRRAANLLNAQAYEGVRALLDDLRVLKVDVPMLQGIFARVRREPAFQGVDVAPLQLDVQVEMPLGVALPFAALEDILGNLFRNAIQASVGAGRLPATVGLAVAAQVDAITGVERAVFFVRDRVVRQLDLEALVRSRITGGLGIVAERVGRYEGTLDLTGPQDQWAKALVVKLPREDLRASNPSLTPIPVG